MTSQSSTPVWLDKNMYVLVLSLLLPTLSEKLGVELSAEKIAALALVAVGYIATHGIKSAKILLKELEMKALAVVVVEPPKP